MPVTIVVGLQWGDEGKGRIVDFLSVGADAVARFGGGANAGHTVRVGEKTYKLRIIPSGVIAGVKHCIIGPGTVVSPGGLVAELDALDAAGVDTSGVWLSDQAHLIMPYHVEIDRSNEKELGADKLGTTGNGIGPAYADRVARLGLTAGRLRDVSGCRAFFERRQAGLDRIGVRLDIDAALAHLREIAPRVLPRICDTVSMLHGLLHAGARIIAEGAQGTMLDVALGSYPFVTSSSTVAGGAGAGLGFGPKDVEHVIGVVKAYTTRVGAGPFPTELMGFEGEALRARGAEFGVVTGRPRRCGWLDIPSLRYAVAVNGVTHLALTKLDVLDDLETVTVCTRYEQGGGSIPIAMEAGAQPRYEQLAGWRESTSSVRLWNDLPSAARAYVGFIEDALAVPGAFVSVGPERSQIIVSEGAPLSQVRACSP